MSRLVFLQANTPAAHPVSVDVTQNWPLDAVFSFLPIDWTAIGVVVNLGLLVSVIFAAKAVRETQKSRTAEVISWAYAQMKDIKLPRDRVKVLDDDHKAWSEQDIQIARDVSNTFQRLSYMVRAKLIDPRHFKEIWAVELVLTWDKLRPWIQDQRSRAGEPVTARKGAFLRKDFELLAEEYRGYVRRKRKGLKRKQFLGWLQKTQK